MSLWSPIASGQREVSFASSTFSYSFLPGKIAKAFILSFPTCAEYDISGGEDEDSGCLATLSGETFSFPGRPSPLPSFLHPRMRKRQKEANLIRKTKEVFLGCTFRTPSLSDDATSVSPKLKVILEAGPGVPGGGGL